MDAHQHQLRQREPDADSFGRRSGLDYGQETRVDDQYRQLPPLRAPDTRTGSALNRPQDQGLDSKRSEELRSQIAFKEQQLQQMRNSNLQQKYQLAGSSQQSSIFQRGRNHSPLRNKNSQLRSDSNSQQRSQNLNQQNESQLGIDRQRGSPLRHSGVTSGVNASQIVEALNVQQEQSPDQFPVRLERGPQRSQPEQLANHQSSLNQYLDTRNQRENQSTFERAQLATPELGAQSAASRPSIPGSFQGSNSVVSSQIQKSEKVQILIIDNSSLQRRLEIVNKEIVRIKSDISQLVGNLDSATQKNQRISMMISDAEGLELQKNLRTELLNLTEEQKSLNLQIQETNEKRKQATDDVQGVEKQIMQDQTGQTWLKQEIDDKDQNISEMQSVLAQQPVQEQELKDQLSELSHKAKQFEEENEEIEGIFGDHLVQKHDLTSEYEKMSEQQNIQKERLVEAKMDMLKENQTQIRLIATKIIFTKLDCGLEENKHFIFDQIALYSSFDKKCHYSMSKLARSIRKQAKLAQKQALSIWFRNALKPQQTSVQNVGIVERYIRRKLLKKAFHELNNSKQVQKDMRNLQQSAMQQLFYITKRNAQIDIKRSLAIWKQQIKHKSGFQQKLQGILTKHIHSMKGKHFQTWKQWSNELEWACRVELLRRQYTQNLFLSCAQSSLRIQLIEKKTSRILKQGLFFKAWNDYIQFKKYQTLQQINMIRFAKEHKKYILLNCFSAMRIHKESQKHQILGDTLEQDHDVAIEQAQAIIAKKQKESETRSKKIGTKVITNMLSKMIYGYLKKWKENTDMHKAAVQTKVKDKFIKVYNSYMTSYFVAWKNQERKKKRHVKKKMVMDMESHGEEMQKELATVQAHNEVQAQAVSSIKRKTCTKAIKKVAFRRLTDAITRWKEFSKHTEHKENKADMILARIRKSLVKPAFDKYRNQIQFQKRTEHQIGRSDQLIATYQKRALKRMYEDWHAYVYLHKKSKQSLKVIFTKLTNWKVRRHLKRWSEGSHFAHEEQLSAQQGALTDEITSHNQLLAEHQNKVDSQHQEAKAVLSKAQTRAQRQLKNYMVRHYTTGSKVAFRTWKEVYTKRKQGEAMLKRKDQHFTKKFLEVAFATFRQHTQNKKTKDRKSRIKMVQLQEEDHIQNMKNNEEIASSNLKEKKKALEVRSVHPRVAKPGDNTKKASFEETEDKIIKTYAFITRKNQTQICFSRKRQVFIGWRHAVTQQKHFLYTVANVCTKSAYSQGFHFLRHHDKIKRHSDRQQRLVRKYYGRFNLNQLKDSFTRWKRTMVVKTSTELSEVEAIHQDILDEFKNKIIRAKDQNTANCEHYFKKKLRLKIWKAWMKTRAYSKMKYSKASEAKGVLSTTKKKRALQKMYLRIQLTKRVRDSWAKFHSQYKIRIKKSIFEAIQWQKAVNNNMVVVLHNLENFMRTKILDDSFKDVKSFYLSKKLATNNFKRRATYDIMSILSERHIRKSRIYFNKYKFKVSDRRQRVMRLNIIYVKFNAQLRHTGFRRWVHYTDKHMDAQELNEIGPVTEEVFEANRLIKNLKDFMRQEGYPEEQIKRIMAEVNEKEMRKISWCVTRWKYSADGKNRVDNRLTIKAFDHLKMAITFRKLMRHWLNFSNNRVQWVKADMQDVFKRWKQGDASLAIELDKKPMIYLQSKNMKQCNVLLRMAENEADSDGILKHLCAQRDELLQHFIRSQKLGLCLCQSNHLKGLGQCFNRWAILLKEEARGKGKGKVMDAVERLTSVKDKLREIEQENMTLANENDELRTFSMDGFKIASNINQLSAEREKLTSDLADQAKMINHLIQENERLKAQLNGMGNKENRSTNQPKSTRSGQVASGYSIRGKH